MSTELERRLDGFLRETPEPEQGVGERALARALDALRPAALTHRRLRTAVLVLAAAGVLLGAAAGSLAAAGALHVGFTHKPKPRPVTTQLTLPRGASGVAVVVDGRLSVVTKSGFRLQGLPVSAAALSPHALYVAAGIGDALVAMAPDGRRAWSHPAAGSVVAIAWAPDGLRIAYIVRANHRLALHVIWGNGTHDAVIDRGVRAVRPSWRADSLAFAYVGAGGRAIVYDLAHASRATVATRAAGAVRQVAFAPSGRILAVATRTEVGLVRPGLNELDDRGQIVGIGWTGRWFAVAHGGAHPVIRLTANPQLGSISPPGRIDAFDAQGHGITVAVSNASGTEVLAAVTGERLTSVLQLPRKATLRDLQIG